MSSTKDSSPNDATSHREKSDYEAAEPAKAGGHTMKWFIISGIISVIAFFAVFFILFYAFSSPATPETPSAEALIGNFSSKSSTKSLSSHSRAVTPSGLNDTASTFASLPATLPPLVPHISTSSSKPVTSSANDSTSESPPSSNNSSQESAKEELIFAQILFRHGARAGDIPDGYEKYFPRGVGMLTDRGYNHSFMMGRFLKKRFVDTGFLNERMNPKEMEWRSRDKPRCLSTASTVGAGMFQTEKQKYVTVPISMRERDYYLQGPGGCQAVEELFMDECPDYYMEKYNRNRTKKSPSREFHAYKCVGANSSVIQNITIDKADQYINMVRNEIPVDEYITNNYDIILEEYLKVRNFINGVGQPKLIQVRFGLLVDRLLKDLKKAWKRHENNETGLKFKVYSSQDWLLSGILEAFGVLSHVQSTGPRPKEEPHYNVLIVMELWKKNGKPYVKFLYKREEVTMEDHKLEDLTGVVVKSCNGKPCSLEKFYNCCDATRISESKREQICRTKKESAKGQ